MGDTMRISSSDMITNLQKIMGENMSVENSQNENQIEISDSVKSEISAIGRRIGNAMDLAGRMDPEKMESKINDAIEELNLSDYNLDEMTEDEISEVASQIHEVMESFRPEHMGSSGFDIESLSSDELETYVSAFQENSKEVISALGKMGGMMNGQPPMGGKPPKGGKPPQGGGMEMNAVDSYTSISEEDDEELSLIESLLEALEADEDSSDTDSSEFYKLIGEYLSANLNT